MEHSQIRQRLGIVGVYRILHAQQPLISLALVMDERRLAIAHVVNSYIAQRDFVAQSRGPGIESLVNPSPPLERLVSPKQSRMAQSLF